MEGGGGTAVVAACCTGGAANIPSTPPYSAPTVPTLDPAPAAASRPDVVTALAAAGWNGEGPKALPAKLAIP